MSNGDNQLVEKLTKRVFEISKKYDLSHIGSCVATLPALIDIYEKKNKNDVVVLSNGHAGVAWYVVEEHFNGISAHESYKSMGVHPTFIKEGHFVKVSTGSLGMGITVACGLSASNPERTVYCTISDGECYEGAVYEALIYIKKYLFNLEIYFIYNEHSATRYTRFDDIQEIAWFLNPRIAIFRHDSKLPWCYGIDSHYYKMKETDNA